MWGNGKKRTFLVMLANVDGNIYKKGEKRGTYLSASRKMPKVKNILSKNSGFKYTVSKGMNFCLTTLQMILEMVLGNICHTRRLLKRKILVKGK